MTQVTKQEIVEALLRNTSSATVHIYNRQQLANRIKQHGIAPEPKGEEAIAPPDGRTPVAWAIDTPYGRAYSFADELLGKWPVPDGWVLVPKEPTQAMLTAADGVDFKNEDTVGTFYNYWHVMLAAAPELLKACQLLISDDLTGEQFAARMEFAKAAIAKARGNGGEK